MRRYYSGYDLIYYSLRVIIIIGKIVIFFVYDKVIIYVWILGMLGDIIVLIG